MIYIADGSSDVPVFAVLNDRGGRTFGVYPAAPGSRSLAEDLHEQGRIQGMAEADFRPGRAAHLWLIDCLGQIAAEIIGAGRPAAADLPPVPRRT